MGLVTRLMRRWRKLCHVQSLHADAGLTAAANVAITAMGFCTGILTARLLGPHGRGQLAAIQTTPSLVATLAMLGMPEALVYFSAQRPTEAGRYLGTAVTVSLLASIPFVLVAYLLMPLLLHAQATSVVDQARWYLLVAPVYAVVGSTFHPLRGAGQFQAWNALRMGVPLAALSVLAVASLAGRITPGFIAFGNLAGYALLLVPCAWIVVSYLGGPYGIDRRRARPMLAYGLPCMMTGLPQMLNLRLDQIAMAALLSSRELGLYVVAVAWSGGAAPLLNSIGAVLLPAVAASADRQQAAISVSGGVRLTAALAIFTSVALALMTPIAIPMLFGASFRAAIPAALILVPAGGVLGVNFSLQEGIRGLGHPYKVLRAEALGLIVTVISLAALLRPLGILGAALSSLAGYTSVTLFLLISARRIAGTTIRSMVLPRAEEMKRGLGRLVAVARELATQPQ